MNSKIIALVSDFGMDDPYIGIMKGVISEISPRAVMIDITHQIPPGDIQRGAFVLWQAAQDLPKGTILLSVVDPGVGTERKGLYLQTRDHVFIGPDNGLFSYILYNTNFTCWELSNPDYQRMNKSATFHGRDIFAPAAAHAAASITGDQFGSQVLNLRELGRPVQKINKNSLDGEILSRDHFGNLFTSLGFFKYQDDQLQYTSWMDESKVRILNVSRIRIQINGKQLPLVRTFDSIDQGTPAGLIGSTGLLEIVANQTSAEDLLGLQTGDPVKLYWD